ncbi:MAG TPA: hypothetical protein PK129_12165 [Cellvibrionaceae bacterium]|nr:hypothetical protein [Cellvibrionaceae bacterium]
MEDLNNKNIFEIVAQCSADLESTLRNKLNAEGRGLIELANSVESKISSDTLKRIRRLGFLRNKLLHENDDSGLNKTGFYNEYHDIKKIVSDLCESNSNNEKADILATNKNDKRTKTVKTYKFPVLHVPAIVVLIVATGLSSDFNILILNGLGLIFIAIVFYSFILRTGLWMATSSKKTKLWWTIAWLLCPISYLTLGIAIRFLNS